MNKDEYLSKSEIEEIDKMEVDMKILENIERNSENTFSKIQTRNTLSFIKQNLIENEIIEFYCLGRNYSMDSMRLALSFLGLLSHHIYGWSTKCILIKTNMRMIFVETTMGLQYSKHYEISKEVHLVKEKEMFYLIVNGNDKKTIVEYNNKLYNLILESISDKVNIVTDKKLNCRSRKAVKGIKYFFIIYLIFIVILLSIRLVKYGGFNY